MAPALALRRCAFPDRLPDTVCLTLQERIYPRGADGGPLLTFGEFLKRENAKAVLCGYNDSVRATVAGGVCGPREASLAADRPASGASTPSSPWLPCDGARDAAPCAPSRLERTYAVAVHTPAGRLIDVLL